MTEILFISLYLFCQKMQMNKWVDVFIWSVGTDGARTRSFRLDRAVLWPIELQSQEIRYTASILLGLNSNLFFFRVVTETRVR